MSTQTCGFCADRVATAFIVRKNRSGRLINVPICDECQMDAKPDKATVPPRKPWGKPVGVGIATHTVKVLGWRD